MKSEWSCVLLELHLDLSLSLSLSLSPNNIIWAMNFLIFKLYFTFKISAISFCCLLGLKRLELYHFAYSFCCKVNTKNIKIPTDKDVEWRWEATTMEIPFLIDDWEKGSHKVSPMCWMEWCSGTPSFLFYSVFFFLLSIRFWTILLQHHTFLLLIIFPFSVPSFPRVNPILYNWPLRVFQPCSPHSGGGKK